MKTLIKPLFLALSLSFVAVSMGEARPGRPTMATVKTGIYSSVNGKLNIALDKPAGGTVEIQLKSSTGDLLYSQHLGQKETTFRTRLNLNELTDGDYVLEIRNGAQTTRQAVTIKTNYALNRVIQTETVAANN